MRIASVVCAVSMCTVCVLQAIQLFRSWKKYGESDEWKKIESSLELEDRSDSGDDSRKHS